MLMRHGVFELAWPRKTPEDWDIQTEADPAGSRCPRAQLFAAFELFLEKENRSGERKQIREVRGIDISSLAL
jgi:hypothetical protein